MICKSTRLCTVLFLGAGLTAGQAQEVVPASGGNASGSGGSVSYSIGQAFYTNITGANGSMDQGIQSIAISNLLLPVSLLNFKTVEYNNNSVLITWQTATEKDNDFFVLEKSTDGKHFAAFTRVPGKGNSSSLSSYKAFDYEPSVGNNYYRLKQTDFDGAVAYSPVSIAYIAKLKNELAVFPNPTSGMLILQTDASAPKTYQIIDLNGRILESKPITSNRMQIDISHLGAAIYIVNILQENQTIQSFKITKK